MIQLENVQKYFYRGEPREIHALRDINLTIEAGEFTLFNGPSGCGKTTLLNAIGALDDVDSGKIYLEDHDIAALDENERTQLRLNEMGFVFQAYNLIPVLNVRENIGFIMKLRGFGDDVIRERVDEVASMLEIDNARLDELISRNRLNRYERELVYLVKQNYYRVLRNYQTLRVNELRLERAKKNLELARERQRPLDIATGYTTRRKAFGATISQFQGVSFQVAEAAMLRLALDLLTFDRRELPELDAALGAWTAQRTVDDVVAAVRGHPRLRTPAGAAPRDPHQAAVGCRLSLCVHQSRG